jgi:hypothetical protein
MARAPSGKSEAKRRTFPLTEIRRNPSVFDRKERLSGKRNDLSFSNQLQINRNLPVPSLELRKTSVPLCALTPFLGQKAL